MASENAHNRGSQDPGFASENTPSVPAVRRGRAAVELLDRYAAVVSADGDAQSSAPLAEQTRCTYASEARQYLALLAAADLDGGPLESRMGATGRSAPGMSAKSEWESKTGRCPSSSLNTRGEAVDEPRACVVLEPKGCVSPPNASSPAVTPLSVLTKTPPEFP